jgi:hypothetical protein
MYYHFDASFKCMDIRGLVNTLSPRYIGAKQLTLLPDGGQARVTLPTPPEFHVGRYLTISTDQMR